jgi:hypothetical protein
MRATKPSETRTNMAAAVWWRVCSARGKGFRDFLVTEPSRVTPIKVGALCHFGERTEGLLFRVESSGPNGVFFPRGDGEAALFAQSHYGKRYMCLPSHAVRSTADLTVAARFAALPRPQ